MSKTKKIEGKKRKLEEKENFPATLLFIFTEILTFAIFLGYFFVQSHYLMPMCNKCLVINASLDKEKLL